jgi:predicted dehydrogenase
MPQARKRYAQVGVGSRSEMYTRAIAETYRDIAEIVAICDPNQGRMDLKNRQLQEMGHPVVATYAPDDFEKMISETHPDTVIVTSVDVTHSDYIVRAMELGCDVITEKPMTTDSDRCGKVLRAVADTGRQCQVTFNYRYSPPRSQVREMIRDGVIGEILSVDFCWVLNTSHGADYFRRWHRNRANSGSLLVHKATHHFDLVNWWLDDVPEEVFCHASRRFYTPQTGDELGLQSRSERCLDCPVKESCKFHLDLSANEGLRTLYLDNESEDGYFRDRCVFSDQIDIWDTMSASVQYRRGALLNYMLHAYSPWEGYRIAFNGSKGRLEHAACENTYISGDGNVPGELTKGNTSITLIPAFAKPQTIEPRTGKGGHGGGDPVLLADVFDPNAPADPLGRKADQRDGAYSILVGIAAYHSIDEGRPIRIPDLLGDAPID